MRRGQSQRAGEPDSEAKRKEAKKQHFRRVVWTLLLVLGTGCSIAALVSPEWVISERARIGILRRCDPDCRSTGMGDLHHPAWRAALFFFALGTALVTLAAVAALTFTCLHRDRALHVSKHSAKIANLAVFLAALIWPVGLHNREDVPCGSNLTEEAAYHMCNPWTSGSAIWLQVVAMVAMALANCVAAFVYTKVQQRKKQDSKKKSKASSKSGWYESRAPILAHEEENLVAEEEALNREEAFLARQQSRKENAPSTSFGDGYAAETRFAGQNESQPNGGYVLPPPTPANAAAGEEEEEGYLDLNFEDEPDVLEDGGDSYLLTNPDFDNDGYLKAPEDTGYMFAQPAGGESGLAGGEDEPEDAGYLLTHPPEDDANTQPALQESEFDDGYLEYK